MARPDAARGVRQPTPIDPAPAIAATPVIGQSPATVSSLITTNPLWWDTLGPPSLSMRPVPARCDVAIVGAGYAGLAAALVLARAGRAVQVFDRQRPGEGASTRNGGIASGNLRESLTAMITRIGETQALRFHAEGKAARADLERFVREESLDCDYQPVGRFTGAVVPAHHETQLREAEALQRLLDIDARAVPAHAVHEEVGTERYCGGLLRPDIAGLNPARLHAGMLALARQAGATVHGETGVTRMRRERDGHELWTLRGPIRARDVIVATNGYTDRCDPWLRRRLVPVPSRIIATEPLDAALMDRLMPARRMHGDTLHLYHYYRPSPDGRRILWGGRAPLDALDPLAGTEPLRRELIATFPDLAGVAISHSWSGFVAFNRDAMPRLFARNGVRYAAGFCGSGVVWARWLGAKAAYDLLGDERAESAFQFRPPAAVPLYRGKPWFLPAVTGWMRLRDALEARRGPRGNDEAS